MILHLPTRLPPSIDLNCDMGETPNDTAMLDYVTSASIACGFHAGDAGMMRRGVQLAIAKGVAIGAHPGLRDEAGFGRRELDIYPGDVYNITLYQIGALSAFVRAEGGTMQHVKPHGALYNMAARETAYAEAITQAVRDADPRLILFGLAGSALIDAGKRNGLRVAAEAFADRRYKANGQLTPRSEADAVIADADEAAAQVIGIVRDRVVRTRDGGERAVEADTICLHGDTPGAVEFARKIRERLMEEGVEVKALLNR